MVEKVRFPYLLVLPSLEKKLTTMGELYPLLFDEFFCEIPRPCHQRDHRQRSVKECHQHQSLHAHVLLLEDL